MMIYFLNQSGPSWYMAKMPEVHHYHKVYEKTPSYTTLKRAPARIFNFDHKIKIIAILCDPGNDREFNILSRTIQLSPDGRSET